MFVNIYLANFMTNQETSKKALWMIWAGDTGLYKAGISTFHKKIPIEETRVA